MGIRADIQPINANNCETYVIGATIGGALMGQHRVEFHAGGKTHGGLRVGIDGEWSSEAAFADGSKQNFGAFTLTSHRGRSINIRVGPLTIKIVRPHAVDDWRWLNLFIKGATALELPVGGVLGLDAPPADALESCTI